MNSNEFGYALSGALILLILFILVSWSIESSAIKACEFNTERVIKCEYIRTAMPITPEQRNK